MSPIYLFYEIVNTNASGNLGNKGDVHYRCLQRLHKICTITKGMNGNLHCNILILPSPSCLNLCDIKASKIIFVCT